MIHFFTGKGGVGKTYASLHFQHKWNFPVFCHEPIPSERIHNGRVTHLDPKLCLKEYLEIKFKFKKAVSLLLDNNFFSSLFEAAPGVESIATTGKIYEEGKRNDLIVDSPSMGHFIPWLTTCQSLKKVVPFGPIRKDAEDMTSFFFNKKSVQIHIVALAQDIVLEESFELYKNLQSEGLPIGKFYINKFLSFNNSFQKGTLEEIFHSRTEYQNNLLKSFPLDYETIDWIPQ